MDRTLSTLDQAITFLDRGLRLLFGPPPSPLRPNPGAAVEEIPLERAARDTAGRLMRVDHSGEICAQALYQGQALTARAREVREKLERSAQEENDHLAWTAERVRELGAHTSYLNPLWYAGSLAIGAAAGLAGDRWSLGFLAETERQVVEHLQGHLVRLPPKDLKSRAIVEQMRDDEGRHATVALEAGAAELPAPVKALMRLSARTMTTTAYWV
jgi:ubiquinone biosynthesis monooxygenase Coq7